MTLSDIRDYIETLTQGTVYVGPIPDKPEKIVGVYNSKHQHEYKVAIGGPQLESYPDRNGSDPGRRRPGRAVTRTMI